MTIQFYNRLVFSEISALFVDEPFLPQVSGWAAGAERHPGVPELRWSAGRPALLGDGKITIQFYNSFVFSEISALFVDHRSTASSPALGSAMSAPNAAPAHLQPRRVPDAQQVLLTQSP